MTLPYVIETNDDGGEQTYEMYSRLLKDRIIFLRGEFDDNMANGIVAQLLYLQSDNAEKDIFMYINSPGGNITSMYAIYDTMQYIKPDIATVGFGSVASAGSFILAAGTKGKRSVLPNTELMIHELSAGASGKAAEIFNTVEKLKRLYEKMATQYQAFTDKDLDVIKKDMQRDCWLDAQEALAYGLVDKVL
jgi:ATP-dependent Clp protease protease subunit